MEKKETLSQIYERFARENGYKDWNTLCALDPEKKFHIKDFVKRYVWRVKKEKNNNE